MNVPRSSNKMPRFLLIALTAAVSMTTINAFQSMIQQTPSSVRQTSSSSSSASSSWRLNANTENLEYVLQERYPSFLQLLLNKENVDVWKNLNKPETVDYSIFCPTEEAFGKLGEAKCAQLRDVRNAEATLKMGSYHVICELVTPDALFDSAGIVTMGGQVPVDRSVTGGMFGIGGKEDGGSLVGGARVLQSYPVDCGNGNVGVIHEVDGLISPNILWRYMDQLRIPLSK